MQMNKSISKTIEASDTMDPKPSTIKVNSFMMNNTIDQLQEDHLGNTTSANSQFAKIAVQTIDGTRKDAFKDYSDSVEMTPKIDQLMKTQGSH